MATVVKYDLAGRRCRSRRRYRGCLSVEGPDSQFFGNQCCEFCRSTFICPYVADVIGQAVHRRSVEPNRLTYTGLAWEGLLRRRKGSGNDAQPMTPLPPVIPFAVYNGASHWMAPLDVSELVAPASSLLARLQPANRYVLLDMQRAKTDHVPKDNAVGLQVALEQATFEESVPILRRMGAALAGPEHAELRKAFAQWVRRSWDEDYRVLTGEDEALRRELARMATAGEVEAMGSLAVERWKERERRKEAQILARGMAQGRTEGLEFDRRLLGSQAARRFGADTGERLSALLAGVSEPERLAAVGDAIIDCGTGAELLAAARRIVGAAN